MTPGEPGAKAPRATGFVAAQDARILILDEAEPREGLVDAYRDAILDGYRPAAEARGMTLEGIWLSPPVILKGGGNSLFVLWSFPDVAAFWRGRFQDNEAKSDWWTGTAGMVVTRKRSILTDYARQADV